MRRHVYLLSVTETACFSRFCIERPGCLCSAGGPGKGLPKVRPNVYFVPVTGGKGYNRSCTETDKPAIGQHLSAKSLPFLPLPVPPATAHAVTCCRTWSDSWRCASPSLPPPPKTRIQCIALSPSLPSCPSTRSHVLPHLERFLVLCLSCMDVPPLSSPHPPLPHPVCHRSLFSPVFRVFLPTCHTHSVLTCISSFPLPFSAPSPSPLPPATHAVTCCRTWSGS